MKNSSPQYWVWRHWLHFLVAPNVPQLLHGSPSSLLPPPFLAGLPTFFLAVLLRPAAAAAPVAVVALTGCGF